MSTNAVGDIRVSGIMASSVESFAIRQIYTPIGIAENVRRHKPTLEFLKIVISNILLLT